MPKIDISAIPLKTGSTYPGALNTEMDGRSSLRLGDAGGLTQFGANIVILEAGAKSSLRHYHMHQDEFAMITQGTCTLIDDCGETELATGDCIAWPAGDANGHHIVNNSQTEARFLVIGTRTESEVAYYSDIDMMVKQDANGARFTRQDGTPLKGDN
jgi:uncharacterized cupin superfamily protein